MTTEFREDFPLPFEQDQREPSDRRPKHARVAPRRPLDAWRSGYLLCRMTSEWVIALILMIPAACLVVVLAAAVKLTSAGPAFYSQTRLGHHGRPFRMRKLRTMGTDSETGTGPIWSTPTDPRVTRVGRFLRNTHLDELPQLWNVLAGEMSLIGPRPERPEIVDQLERALSRYRERLLVRPGLTGLAQMQLPADSNLESVRRKLAYDLHYVHNVSPWLDLRIVISTVFYLVSLVSRELGRELMKSERRAVEHHADSVELLDDESIKIGTS